MIGLFRLALVVGVLEFFLAGPRFGLSYMFFGYHAYDAWDRLTAALFATAIAGAIMMLVLWAFRGFFPPSSSPPNSGQ